MECNNKQFSNYWISNNDIIIIKQHFNDDIKKINLSNGIKTIIFANYVIVSIDNTNNAKYKVMSKFNQTVDNLPHNLLNLTFGDSFNQTVDNLPHNLLNLTFGDSFNQTVDYLPSTLINLTFGCYFNQSLNNLPNLLISVNFAKNNDFYRFFNYNKQLNCLPNSICEIILPENYEQEIKHIPFNLKKIYCSSTYKYINKLGKIQITHL